MIFYSKCCGVVLDTDWREEVHNVLLYEKGFWSHLSPLAFDILAYLVFNQGKYRTRSEIAMQVWGDCNEGRLREVEVYILDIRKAIGDNPKKPTMLVAKDLFGYMLDPSIPTDLLEKEGVISAAGVVVWPDAKRAFANGVELELFGNAFKLLAHLVANAGPPVSVERLIAIVWPDGGKTSKNLKEEVRFVRKAIEAKENLLDPKILLTVKEGRRVVAYRFSLTC